MTLHCCGKLDVPQLRESGCPLTPVRHEKNATQYMVSTVEQQPELNGVAIQGVPMHNALNDTQSALSAKAWVRSYAFLATMVASDCDRLSM